ncbi:MAG: 1-acyl-sn-glycerol-3-phosphate acyltransferase [Cyclobacteriaceae bacterium]|nr:1-acyl-sn-glycerol-3-phosphate acyltransferase [Cyclobacteriaceae bacterium]
MKKVLYVLYQPYKWLFFAPFFIINSVFFGILAVLLSPLSQRMADQFGGIAWARLNGILTPILVRVRGRENIRKGQSYVIVANHQSMYDIFVLYGWMGMDIKWVMKKEVRKMPGVGFGSVALGHIIIDRSSIKTTLETIEKAKDKIKGGTSVVFFPEGSRSRTEEMLPFKKGAYRFAFDLNLPILPVTINGTRKILPPGTLDIRPGRAEIYIHPPVDIKKFGVENIAGLMEHTRETIQSVLK